MKRLNYFHYQFLQENDFTDEQDYHLSMRRRHNTDFHTWGRVQGLDVTFAAGERKVTISPGMAVDSLGREIILESNYEVDLQNHAGETVYLALSYNEQESDPTTQAGVSGNTRLTESFHTPVSTTPPTEPNLNLILAKIKLNPGPPASDGAVTSVDKSERTEAGAKIGESSFPGLKLMVPGHSGAEWPELQGVVTGAPGSGLQGIAVTATKTTFSGAVQVNGNIGLGATGTVDGRDVSADGTKLDNHVASTANPHVTTAAQVGALPAIGGTLSGNLQVNASIGVTGTVDGRDVSADGTKLDSHVASTANPHATTAVQVGALPATGGTLSGNLQVNASIGVTGTVDGRDVSADGATLDAHRTNTANPHATTAAQVGALATTGGTINGLVTIQSTGNSALRGHATDSHGILGRLTPNPASGYSYNPAGVVGISEIAGKYGVNANAPSGTYALFVSGTAYFSGAKTGYVADIFVNKSGQQLHTGDVVKLKGTPLARYMGDLNKIPVAEVTLADKENDTMTIGIVDRESIAHQGTPDTRINPDDPTSIEDGCELFVVTLGAYAHCKADASEAPIEVGDLLTSSANPGYAKKATNPKIGCIIGKALEPLKEGTGYISVFVNIQ